MLILFTYKLRARINPIETFVDANRQRTWFGHVSKNKMPDTRMPKHHLKWTHTHDKRSRGRLRKNWMNWVLKDASAFSGEQNDVLDRVGGTSQALESERVDSTQAGVHQCRSLE